jgi:hypothetical protein
MLTRTHKTSVLTAYGFNYIALFIGDEHLHILLPSCATTAKFRGVLPSSKDFGEEA